MLQPHSIGTTTLVALLAAHRQAEGREGASRPSPHPSSLDPGEIRRIAERLWATDAMAPAAASPIARA
jgi:hypothetical protein